MLPGLIVMRRRFLHLNLTRILVNEHAIALLLPPIPSLAEVRNDHGWCARLTHAHSLHAVFADALVLSPT